MLASTARDIAAWLAAVGTVGALLVSLLLVRSNLIDRRREQASLVASWWSDLTQESEGYVVSYLVGNGSRQPVYDVVLNAALGVRGTFVRQLGTLAPGETRLVKVLAGGAPRSNAEDSPGLGFTDSAGRVWQRDHRGRLNTPSSKDRALLYLEDSGAYESIEDRRERPDRDGFAERGTRVE